MGQVLKAFRDELKQLENGLHLLDAGDLDLHILRDTCNEVATLTVWRNDRIHAIVEPVNAGLALYDWRTGKPLSISYQECQNVLQRLSKVVATLGPSVAHIVRSLEAENEINAFFDQLVRQQELTTEP